jgi:uncharacterized protein (DUF1697 family)
MTAYISILRGINVSGHKKILMSDLKTLFENLGFISVSTYIQSGNVIFQSTEKLTPGQVAEKIGNAIFQKYQFEVPVIVRTFSEMKKTLSSNPFMGNTEINIEKLHVTFLSAIPGQEYIPVLMKYDFPPDKFVVIGKDVFLYCPESYGDTKLSNAFFENKLKVSATTRNWKTVTKLMEALMNIA